MKKFVISFVVALLCLVFTECDNQLDLKPLGQLDENIYYQTEKDFEAASLSPYSTILNLYYDQNGRGWYQGILYPDDDVVPRNNENNDQEDFNWNPDNGQFSYLWETFYKGIQRSNIILERLPLAKNFVPIPSLRGESAPRPVPGRSAHPRDRATGPGYTREWRLRNGPGQ